MKKSFLFAVAFAGMLCSCSQDESISQVENSDLVPIKIGMSNPSATRGTGTVGGLDDATNIWNGQKFNLYMLKKGTTTVAPFTQDGTDYIYNNTEFTAPTDVSSGLAQYIDKDGKTHYAYYPTQGNYDFWAYRLDGAAKAEPTITDAEISVDFELDGSQDVMVAKAVPTEDDILKMQSQGADVERVYSAYSARKGVQPNIVFKHLLSRFTFSVTAGSKETTDPTTGVYVEEILVKSKNTGKLIVAYTGTVENQIQFNDEVATLSLKERTGKTNEELTTLTPQQPKWNESEDKAEVLTLGEAMLLAPSDSYDLEIKLRQDVVEVEGEPAVQKRYSYTDTINPDKGSGEIATDKTFMAGKSYNVNINIWGLSKIEITTVLTPWVDGGSVNLTPEDNQ